ncbi:hypothetical protein DL95DRAFT_468705 [Leptodontidium sp. 2 PMI_412]|nr:hypothetical protein DL95DRAFT_468705 [Leptodontidium sp. 2 PMI_412]
MSQAALNAESGVRVRGLVEDLGLGLRLRRDNEGIKGEDGGEDMEEYLEGVHMGHVDEFVALFFGLGLLRSDTPQPLAATTPSETDINHLARILHTWLSTTTNSPTQSILLAKSHGHILGSQLLTTCLNKGVSAKSLYHLVQDAAGFYTEYCQDLEDEAGKEGWERDVAGGKGRGMGKVLKLVLGRDRVGVDVPGWETLSRNANGMFALLHGASEEIGEVLRRVAESGI